MREDRGHVGRDVVLPLAQADHDPAGSRLGGDYRVGLPVRHHADCVGAAHFRERAAHGLGQAPRFGPVVLDQVRQHLGVRLGLERVARRLKRLLERQVVLEDPVVDDHDRAGAVGVRVGVLLGGPPVGGPARVTDPEGAVERALAEGRLEVAETPGTAPDLEHPVGDDGDARGVVPAVLEALQAVEDDAGCASRTDVPNDSTHCVVTSPWSMRLAGTSGASNPRASWAARGFGPIRGSRRHDVSVLTPGCCNRATPNSPDVATPGPGRVGAPPDQDVPASRRPSSAPGRARRRAVQPSLTSCAARSTARAPGGTSFVITEPAPT